MLHSYEMSWDDIYNHMAFASYKGDLARRNTIKDAVTTLYLYLQGQEKAFSVIDALDILEKEYGVGVKMACESFYNALKIEDETARESICMEAIGLIERYIVRNHSACTRQGA